MLILNPGWIAFWKIVPEAFFLLSHCYNPEWTKCMQLVIIPCSEETVYKIHINIWVPFAHSANPKVILQRHQGSTENILWHNKRNGVCTLPLDIATCLLKQASKQTNKQAIVFIAKFQLKIWSMLHGITEKFKLEITSSPSKILVKGRLVSCTDL